MDNTFETGRGLYEKFTKDQLIDLLMADSRNIVAMDGVWFQSVERELGMDAAMHHDEEAWKRYTVTEARRIKKFLGLEEHPGLEGLMRALPLRMVDRANETSVELLENRLLYKIVTCRVQEARTKKNMPLHPCKSAAVFEYGFFASAICFCQPGTVTIPKCPMAIFSSGNAAISLSTSCS